MIPLNMRYAMQNFSDRLSGIGAKKPAFVIIGTGRCGTNFVADYLSAAGHPCGHERFYRPSGPLYASSATKVSLEGDSSWLAVPFLPDLDIRVVHQTRAPLLVIQSFLKLGFFHPEHYARHRRYVDFAKNYFEFSDDPIRSAARWWIEWNQKCIEITDKQFRLEDFYDCTEQLSDWLGFETNLPILDVSDQTNTKRAIVATSNDLLHESLSNLPEFAELVDLAHRLGYDL